MEEEGMTSKISNLLAQLAAVEAARELEAEKRGVGPNIDIGALTADGTDNFLFDKADAEFGKEGDVFASAVGRAMDSCLERVREGWRNAGCLGSTPDGGSPEELRPPPSWESSPLYPSATHENDLGRSTVGTTMSFGVSPVAPEDGALIAEGNIFTPCAYHRRSCQQVGEAADGGAITPSVSPTSAAAGLTPSVYSARVCRSESAQGAVTGGVATMAAAASSATVFPGNNADRRTGVAAPQMGRTSDLAGYLSCPPAARLDWDDAVDHATGGVAKAHPGWRGDARCVGEKIGGIHLADELSSLCTSNIHGLGGGWGLNPNMDARPACNPSYTELAPLDRPPMREDDVLLEERGIRLGDHQHRQLSQGSYDCYPPRSGQPEERLITPLSTLYISNRNSTTGTDARNGCANNMTYASDISPNARVPFTSTYNHHGKGWNGEQTSGMRSAFPDPSATLRTEDDADALLRLASNAVHHRHYSSHPAMQQRREMGAAPMAVNMVGDLSQSLTLSASGLQNRSDSAVRSRGPLAVPSATGRTVKLASDQQGCRMLQSILQQFPYHSPDVQRIISELLPVLPDVMKDPYGNFLVQKLLEVAPDEERMRLLDSYISSSLCDVAVSPHGNYAVQKLIDSLRSGQEVQIVCRALQRGTLRLMTDLNGGHVIQKLLQCIPHSELTFLYDVIVKDTVEVCNNKHGCCVVQKCMDYATSAQLQRTQKVVLRHMQRLSLNPYGNYVVTHLVSMCTSPCRQHVVDDAAHCAGPVLELLCANKFASNVVEKIVRGCSASAKLKLCRFLFNKSAIQTGALAKSAGADHGVGEPNAEQPFILPARGTSRSDTTALETIALNPYGNYVVQTMLDVLPISPELAQLLHLLHRLSAEIMKHNFGRRIASKMEQARDRIIVHLQERGIDAGVSNGLAARYSADRAADAVSLPAVDTFQPSLPLSRQAARYTISSEAAEVPPMRGQDLEVIKMMLSSLGNFSAPAPAHEDGTAALRPTLTDSQRAVDMLSRQRSHKRKQSQRCRKG